jgi:hypothetical protein
MAARAGERVLYGQRVDGSSPVGSQRRPRATADGDRRRPRSDPLVPEQRPQSDVGVHLRDRARRGDNACLEPLRQQSGGEPVIAVAVGDEDVSDVPALSGDPVAERTRLICRHRGVR